LKRIGGLFPAIAERENLLAAACAAARGKRQRSVIAEFFGSLEARLAMLSSDLRAGICRFEPYSSFAVRDSKSRTIHAPSFRDRVIHHAIIAVTGPVFELGASTHSYACRRGRGQHLALAAARRWTQPGGWYGKIDVEKFYDSVDHGVLRRLLARRFRERRLLDLFDRVLDSYSTSPGKGLPIGALTSQYLGNFLLDDFDRRVRVPGESLRMARYMDDVVFWGDRSVLDRIRARASEVLGTLRLRMKLGGEWNRCEQGVPFLGFVVYPDRLRLGEAGRKRLRRKLRVLERGRRNGRVSEAELQARVTSIFAHARHGDDVGWRRAVIAAGAGVDEVGPGGRRVVPARPRGWLREERRAPSLWEAQEPRSRRSRRLLEQQGQELPLGDPQQEEARQPQQESGLPCLSVPRHGGDSARHSSAPWLLLRRPEAAFCGVEARGWGLTARSGAAGAPSASLLLAEHPLPTTSQRSQGALECQRASTSPDDAPSSVPSHGEGTEPAGQRPADAEIPVSPQAAVDPRRGSTEKGSAGSQPTLWD
jgi:hypothetical protein